MAALLGVLPLDSLAALSFIGCVLMCGAVVGAFGASISFGAAASYLNVKNAAR